MHSKSNRRVELVLVAIALVMTLLYGALGAGVIAPVMGALRPASGIRLVKRGAAIPAPPPPKVTVGAVHVGVMRAVRERRRELESAPSARAQFEALFGNTVQ